MSTANILNISFRNIFYARKTFISLALPLFKVLLSKEADGQAIVGLTPAV